MDIRIVDGNLTKDAEIKTDKRGVQYLSFTLANNDYVNQERVTTYFNVVSYNNKIIERELSDKKRLTKGSPAVITGFPKENITVKDGKAYLNRYLNALNIEVHKYASNKDENNNTYHDVAPICEAPQVPQPTAGVAPVQAPTYSTSVVTNSARYANPVVEAPSIPTPKVQVQPQVTPMAATPAPTASVAPVGAPSVDDDLPF